MLSLTTEKSVLRLSVFGAFSLAALGIGFGLMSGAASILFDGVYSLIDAVMAILTLVTVNLITGFTVNGGLSRKLRERFNMGFWHLEPMVIGLNGTLLIAAAIYAFFISISAILAGGRELEFGWAIGYAAVTSVMCFSLMALEIKANRRINSAFIALDIKGWLMSGSITTALLIAFGVGLAVKGTDYAWIAPYVDPTILGLICVAIIPVPIITVVKALGDVFLVTPPELKSHVDAVAASFVKRHGLISYRSYVARVGRSRTIEVYFIVPSDGAAYPIGHWDGLREEVSEELGGEGPDRWLIIVFTGDPAWAE